MVKRQDIKPGFIVQVLKEMPGGASPGPRFHGKLLLRERLEILSLPFKDGSTNLVRIRRFQPDETLVVLYSFITNFCGKPARLQVPPAADSGG